MRNLSVAMVAAAALAILVACGDTFIGGDQITNNIVLPGGGGAVPSPSPGAGCPVAGVIDSIRVGPFGIDCPQGIPQPRNGESILPVSCRAQVTATPKDAAGNDVPATVHGQGIRWAVVVGSQVVDMSDDSRTVFNKFVTVRQGVTSGEFRIEAELCGKTGAWNARVCVSGPGCGA